MHNRDLIIIVHVHLVDCKDRKVELGKAEAAVVMRVEENRMGVKLGTEELDSATVEDTSKINVELGITKTDVTVDEVAAAITLVKGGPILV